VGLCTHEHIIRIKIGTINSERACVKKLRLSTGHISAHPFRFDNVVDYQFGSIILSPVNDEGAAFERFGIFFEFSRDFAEFHIAVNRTLPVGNDSY
jgi:hypothetical protein